MADPMSGPITRCPWCSTEVPDPSAERCPTCGAMLVAGPDVGGDIKGVTTLDPEAILRARSEVSRPRGNRLLSFITGEVPQEAPAPSNPDSIAPPDDAVRLEMLRLQLAAESADIEAEAVALKADELARRGIHVSELGDVAAQAPAERVDPEAIAAEPAGGWPAELTPEAREDPPPPAS